MGNNMKNLFGYATSELSQDAFLCWLFENYDCENENVRNTAIALLKKMTGLSDLTSESVQDLKTERQVSYTYNKTHCVFDIVVLFTYNGATSALLIEDKIYSSASCKQEEIYPEAFNERFNECAKHFYAFYKTDLILNKALEKLKTAGWNVFSLNEINVFFKDRPSSNCLILDQYVEHIRQIHGKATVVSTDPMTKWKGDRLLFRTFINQRLIPHAKSLFGEPRDGVEIGVWGRQYYPSFGVSLLSNGFWFSIEIIFRLNKEQAEVIVRVKKRVNDEKDDKAPDKTIRNPFRSALQSQRPGLFCKRDNKWCVASGSKELDEKLRYENGADAIEATCRDLIDAFAAACEEMKGADCYEE